MPGSGHQAPGPGLEPDRGVPELQVDGPLAVAAPRLLDFDGGAGPTHAPRQSPSKEASHPSLKTHTQHLEMHNMISDHHT